MLTLALTEVVLPAWSIAIPVTFWAAPSVVTVCGIGQLAIPEIASEHEKVRVSVVSFQPLLFGGDAATALIVGAVVSIFKLTLASASTFAALSRLKNVTAWVPSAATLNGPLYLPQVLSAAGVHVGSSMA